MLLRFQNSLNVPDPTQSYIDEEDLLNYGL
jgi:hypothetical protein